MPEFEFSTCLGDILNDQARVKTNGSAVLREQLQDGEQMQLHLLNLPEGALILRPEKLGKLAGLRDGEWHKACDFVVVCSVCGSDFVIFIELKRTLRDGVGQEQLRWSQPMIRYLRSVCLLKSSSVGNAPDFNAVFWMFGSRDQRRLDKQPIRSKQDVRTIEYRGISIRVSLQNKIELAELLR